MLIRVGFSADPDDAFMFWGLASGTVDARGYDFAHRVLPFDQIQPAVADGDAHAGLLIHEGQLTYRDADLVKCLDLGEWWLLETGLPLPLGVNTVRRDIGDDAVREVSDILH